MVGDRSLGDHRHHVLGIDHRRIVFAVRIGPGVLPQRHFLARRRARRNLAAVHPVDVGMRVVHRHADLALHPARHRIGHDGRAREQHRVPDRPLLRILAVAFPETLLHDAETEYLEVDLGMLALLHGRHALALVHMVRIHHVHELDVVGVHVVLRTLQPVAGHAADADVVLAVLAHQIFEARQQRNRRLAEIGPDHPRHDLHRVGLQADPVLERAVGRFGRRIHAAPCGIVFPRVIRAAQAVAFDESHAE